MSSVVEIKNLTKSYGKNRGVIDVSLGIEEGDIAVVDKSLEPQHGDIVSFRDPDSSKILIKRVIGLPGDVISFDGRGNIFRNGEQLQESYLLQQQRTFAPREQYTVPEGCFFAMGDNRESSADSRFKDTTYMQITSIYAKELFSFYAPIFFLGSKY